jgi:predicted nucleotidyltransferase
MVKMLLDIEPSIRKVLEHFLEEVLARQRDNILRVILFGSAARGDYNENSDVDVFLLMKHYSLLGQVNDDLITSSIIADEENDYETYISPFAMSLEDYLDSERIGISVVKNIKEEGIVLYDAQK